MAPKRRARRKPAPEERTTDDGYGAADDQALALVQRWLGAEERWKSDIAAAPYDGVFGTLPIWIPRGINSEFTRIRNNLLRESVRGQRVTHELALLWIGRYAKLGETDEDTYIPSEVFEIVGQLARWRYIASLGQGKGLKELGVPSAAFLGRKSGAHQTETVYIEALMDAFPHDDSGSLWLKLRRFVENPDAANNPTPGACPFVKDFDKHGHMIVLKRGKPYKEGAFKTTLTSIRKRRR